MRRIRLAIFVMQLNTIGGGAHSVIRNWCSLLNKEQFDVHVLVVSNASEVVAKDFGSIENIRVTAINKEELPWYSALIIFRRLYGYLKNERIDILHTVFIQADILGALAAKMAGVSVLLSSILGYLVNPMPQGSARFKRVIYKTGYSLVKRKFDRFLTISEANSVELRRHFNVPKDKLQVIYCGIKLDHQDLYRPKGSRGGGLNCWRDSRAN